MKYLIISLLLIFTLHNATAQKVERQVMGAGGGSMHSASYGMKGTLSQNAIGLMRGNMHHGGGFWYVARHIIDRELGVIVSIPVVEGDVGDVVSIPLMIEYNPELKLSGARNFTAEIRYNSTLMDPIGESPDCDYDYETCTMTITGEIIPDTIGVLSEFQGRIKLGNAPSTEIEIVSFEFVETRTPLIVTNDGRLDVTDLCIDGDTVRLIRRTNPEGIMSVYPNPVQNKFTVEYQVNTAGIAELYLMNSTGNKVKRFMMNIREAGNFREEFVAEDFESGAYFLVLLTKNESYTKKIMISK